MSGDGKNGLAAGIGAAVAARVAQGNPLGGLYSKWCLCETHPAPCVQKSYWVASSGGFHFTSFETDLHAPAIDWLRMDAGPLPENWTFAPGTFLHFCKAVVDGTVKDLLAERKALQEARPPCTECKALPGTQHARWCKTGDAEPKTITGESPDPLK